MPSNETLDVAEKTSDIIYSIINGTPFKIRSDEEKFTILEKGRPLHNLNIEKRDFNRNSSKNFHSSCYSIHKWLCGSKIYNKLFCWPCLLMRPETSSWCSTGNDDLKKINSLAAKHARCKSHLKAIGEYDETLKNVGLTPEFSNDLNFTLKEEEGSLSDKTDADDNSANIYFQEIDKNENMSETKHGFEKKPKTSDSNKIHQNSKISSNITFKTWKEIYRDSFLVTKSQLFEDFHLYKWKKKIAKQELKNARLAGEKLKFEIEVLKAKIEYQKALNENITWGKPSTTTSTVSES